MCFPFHYEKRGVLQLAFQFNFWITMTTSNSSYFYIINDIKQVEWVVRVAIHHIYDATQYNSLQFHYNSVKTTHFQLLCKFITTIAITSY